MEESIGITEYLFSDNFIGGIVKHRISDFVVNEIDREMQVVRLTGEETINFEEYDDQTLEVNTEEDVEVVLEQAKQTLNDEQIDGLRLMLNEKRAGNNDMVIEFECPEVKDDRRKIHDAIKTVPSLLSATDMNANKIRVFFQSTARSAKKRRDLKLDDRIKAKPPSKHVEFVLWKTNIDTMKAVKQLSKMIGARPKYFGVAGNKDKRGITSQRVSCFFSHMKKLRSVKYPSIMKVGNFRFTNEPLHIGDLFGNRFTMIIRNINALGSELIDEKVRKLQELGFVNYFGLQRFGNNNAHPTHLVGLAILKKDYEAAINMVLSPRENASQQENAAREHWVATRDVESTFQLFPEASVTPI